MRPFSGSLFDQTVTSADLATVLGSSMRLGCLCLILGRLLAALGYANGNTSLAAAIDNASRLLVLSPPCANAAAMVVAFFELVLEGASTRFRAASRASPGEPFPVFYPLGGTVRSYQEEQIEAFRMVDAIWCAQCVPTAALSPLPVARTPAPLHAPARARTPARSPALLLAPPGLPRPTALSLIGSESSESLDNDSGSFRIERASTARPRPSGSSHSSLAAASAS